jgi:uridine phosphorylase
VELPENILGTASLPACAILLFGRQENLWMAPEELLVSGGGGATRIISFEGREYGVLTSGVGSAQVALTVEAAARAGVERMVGIGFLGSLAPGLKQGDIVVAEAAIRFEGGSRYFVPPWLPALAEFALRERVCRCLEAAGHYPQRAVIATMDVPLKETSRHPLHSFFNIAGYDMETATFYALAWRYRIPAVSVFVVMDDAARKFYRMDKLEQYQIMNAVPELFPPVCRALADPQSHFGQLGFAPAKEPWALQPPAAGPDWA